MASENMVILIGRLGKDPVISWMKKGTAVCSFSMATARAWKDKDGTKKEETEWHNITVFDKHAEACAEYLKKGSQVFVKGRLKTDKYDKDGQTHYATKIIADRVVFLDKKEGQETTKEENRPPDDFDVPF